MSLLSEQDKGKYFPLITLTGPALAGAINHAQTVAETEAGRPLDLTQFIETIEVPPSRCFSLKYVPIDFSQPFAVQYQTHLQDGWRSANANDYDVTPDGQFETKLEVPRLRVQYSSGLQNNERAKAAVAAILNYHYLS